MWDERFYSMNERNKQAMRVKDLPVGLFLRLILLGSVRSPTTGRKMTIDSNRKKLMSVVGANLPLIFFALFFLGAVDLSWPHVFTFLVVVVVLYVAGVRSAILEEKGS